MLEKGKQLEVISKQKKKLLLEIDEILEGKDNTKLINTIDKYILGYIDISSFNGFGDDKQHDKDFEQLCSYLQKETMRNVKEMTVFEFYSLMTTIKRKSKKWLTQ